MVVVLCLLGLLFACAGVLCYRMACELEDEFNRILKG